MQRVAGTYPVGDESSQPGAVAVGEVESIDEEGSGRSQTSVGYGMKHTQVQISVEGHSSPLTNQVS